MLWWDQRASCKGTAAPHNRLQVFVRMGDSRNCACRTDCVIFQRLSIKFYFATRKVL